MIKFAKIKAIIAQDATSRYYYEDEDGNNCVIGGLAKAAGIPFPSRKRRDPGFGAHIMTLDTLADALEKYYGLSMAQLQGIQEVNDKWGNTESRRLRLLEYVNKLEASAA